jgi:O-antigen/teichoic acid export membrane protein
MEEETTTNVALRPQAVAAEPSSLKRQVVSGIGWKLITQVVVQGTRTAVGIVLARLLSPHDYGLAAMALLFVSVTAVFTDLSLGVALISRRTITEDDRSTSFWTTVAIGALCTGVGIAIAPLVARLFSTPAVAPLFAAASGVVLLISISATQNALLTREMQFRSLQLREMGGAVIGGIVGVTLAVAGFGAWALVVQVLAAEAVALVLVWRFSPWRPRAVYSTDSLRRLGSFAGKTSGARILGYVNLNADNFLIAKFLGAVPLGVYTVAYNVMFAPLSRLALPIQQVLFPAFARMADDPPRVGAAWLRGNRLVAAVSVPAFVGLIVVAPDFVPAVLGDRWHKAIPVLQLLCIAGLAQSLQSLNHSILQALDRAGALLAFMIFSATLTVAAFVVGLHWGVVGVAAGFAAARTIVLPVFTTIVCRAARTGVTAFVQSVRTPLEVAAAMGALTYALRLLLIQLAVPAGARLAIVIAAGAFAYLALLVRRDRELVVEARALLPRRGR